MQHASREAIGGCTKLSSECVAAICAERFCCDRSYGCFNSSKFQWVACPDSGAGTRPKRHAVLKFPFLAVMLVPGQQRLTVFCVLLFWVLRPHPVFHCVVAGTGIVLSTGQTEMKDHEMDGAGAGRSPPRCDPNRGQRVEAGSFVFDVDGARCFKNISGYKLHGELDVAGDSACLRRAGGWRTIASSLLMKRHSSSRSELDVAGDSARLQRAGGRMTFSSSLSVKRCSSSTLSRSQARCCSSACAARAEAGW